MKRLIQACGILGLILLCVGVAAAQNNVRLDGQILDANGKPLADATVTLKSADTGQVYTMKTDKNGKFVQLGMHGGVYDVNVTSSQTPPFNEKFQVKEGQDNNLVVNFKELIAQQATANPDAEKKRAEEENAFKNMKVNFEAGVAAMNDANAVLPQLRTATADQKSALQQKRTAACQTAVTAFEQAEKGVGPKDVNNHALVWSNLGAAYECAGRFDDAASAFQKSIDLKPTPQGYRGLSTNLANAAGSATDPAAIQSKVADASAACDKAVALDPTVAAACWKNVGIALYNKQHQKEATGAFQKATQADPKDAQTWFLLGSSLAAQIDSKQEGSKEIYIIPPGTEDAYQKCVDVDPNGPYAAQAKEGLAELKALSGGVETSVGKKKH